MAFTPEQLNFFKFSTIVLDEFPVALRKVFVYMWDNLIATTPGVPKWDDSVTVLNLLIAKEGGVKKAPKELNKSFKEWECSALVRATLFAQTFAMPDGTGGLSKLDRLYVKPHAPSAGKFHPSVISPTGNQAETYALALDQLRLLRNTLCHSSSTKGIGKVTFDHYVMVAKDAFTALGQSITNIDEIGNLDEEDFPTSRLQQVEDELKREKDSAIKFKQIDDHLNKIESQVEEVKKQIEDVGSDVKDVKTEVADFKTQVKDVGSDVKAVKTEITDIKTKVKDVVTDVKTQVEDVGSDVKDVKTGVTDVKTRVKVVRSDVKDVKTEVKDVKTQVEDVGSDVKDMKTGVTDVKTRVEVVRSDVKDVKTEVTDVKTRVGDVWLDQKDMKMELADIKRQMADVGSLATDVNELRTDVVDIKHALEVDNSNGPSFSDTCIPDTIPYFVGRQRECQAILDHLTNGSTRLIDVWGPPGFGKTSVAIHVAHQLRKRRIPVYFTSLRGMTTKDDLVSRLLSIFVDAKQAFHVSPSDWFIQCLQKWQSPFVLILDNADDLLESGDGKLKEEFLRLIEEAIAQCNQMKLFITSRESLEFFNHKLPIHLERVGALDEASSSHLVETLLPDVSERDRNSIIKECGRVPLAMRLMCSTVGEENVSVSELLEESTITPLVEVLDNEDFPSDARLKTIISTSFQRLTTCERDAFVSLAVFPSCFGKDEARAVLNLKNVRQTKKIIRSLKRKSLVDCSDDFEYITIHSLLRSFVDERRIASDTIQNQFWAARLRFYDYLISHFDEANVKFLTGHSNDAVEAFHSQRENILLALDNGGKDDNLYFKVVEVLSKAELFLYAVLPNEQLIIDTLYSTAVREAKNRQCRNDEYKLLAAKSFSFLGGFYLHGQSWDQTLQGGTQDPDNLPAKLLSYLGVHQLLSRNVDEGIASLRASVNRLSDDYDERILRILAYRVLAVCYRKKGDEENASDFETLCANECRSSSFCPAFQILFSSNLCPVEEMEICSDLDSTSVIENDVFLFVVMAELLPLLYMKLEFDKQTATELSIMTHHLIKFQKVILKLFSEGLLHVRVLEACCNALYNLHCHKEAAEGFQMIIDKFEKTPGGKNISADETYVLCGCSLYELGHHEAAFCYFKKALEIKMQLLNGTRQEETVDFELVDGTIATLFNCLNTLNVLNDTTAGRNDDFKATFEELHSIFKSRLNVRGIDLADVANCHSNLASCQFFLRDLTGALESFQQTIKIMEENVDDLVKLVTNVALKGNTHFEMKQFIEAKEAYVTALNLNKRAGTEANHSLTSDIYFNLGEVHRSLGEFNESLEAHLQAFQLRKKHLGDHIFTATSLNRIGIVYLKMKKWEAARDQFQNAVDLMKTLVSGGHEETACALSNLSEAHFAMANHRDAHNFCKEALDMRLKILGEHKQTAKSFHILGSICFEMKDFNGAVRSFRRASEIRIIILGDHLDTALSCHCLGEVQMYKGDVSDALVPFHVALSIREGILGFHSPDTAATLQLLGRAYRDLGLLDLGSPHILN